MEYSTNDIIEAMNNCDNVEDLKADILNRIKNQWRKAPAEWRLRYEK